MKRQISSVLAAAAVMMGLNLYGLDIPVENATQFKIVKCQIEITDDNDDAKVNDLSIVIPAKSTKTVSIPDEGIDDITALYFFFENGMEVEPGFDELKKVHKIKFTYEGKWKAGFKGRKKSTQYPVGQVRFVLSKEADYFMISPLGKDEWTRCKLIDAKGKLYAVPTTGKYEIKVIPKRKAIKTARFSMKKAGYDFTKIAVYKVSYTEIACSVDED